MTRVTFQNGKVLFRDGKAGTEAGCCCGGCKVPCPDYCCPGSEGGGFPPLPVYYSGSIPAPQSANYCEPNPCPAGNAYAQNDFQIVCGGDTYNLTLQMCADITCSETDADHPTDPGCGRNCTLVDPVVTLITDPAPPCYDEANIVFLYCPDPCP